MGQIHKTPAVSLFLAKKEKKQTPPPHCSPRLSLPSHKPQRPPEATRRRDPLSAMEEQVVTERIRRKLEEVNATVQQHLAGVQDHVNFTMQVRKSSGGGSWDPPPRFPVLRGFVLLGREERDSCGTLVRLALELWSDFGVSYSDMKLQGGGGR